MKRKANNREDWKMAANHREREREREKERVQLYYILYKRLKYYFKNVFIFEINSIEARTI